MRHPGTTPPLSSFTVEKFRVLGRFSAQNAKFLDSERAGATIVL